MTEFLKGQDTGARNEIESLHVIIRTLQDDIEKLEQKISTLWRYNSLQEDVIRNIYSLALLDEKNTSNDLKEKIINGITKILSLRTNNNLIKKEKPTDPRSARILRRERKAARKKDEHNAYREEKERIVDPREALRKAGKEFGKKKPKPPKEPKETFRRSTRREKSSGSGPEYNPHYKY